MSALKDHRPSIHCVVVTNCIHYDNRPKLPTGHLKGYIFMKIILIALSLVAVAGCQSPGRDSQASSPTISTDISRVDNSSNYQPDDQKEYLFKKKPEDLQEYPIRMFCSTPDREACFNGIDYQNYVGKKFYYISDQPVKPGGFAARDFYKLRTETGEELYHYRKQELSAIHDMDIVALNEKEAAEKFKKEPIVKGASTMLTGIRRSSEKYGRTYDLSNGGTISETQLDALRKLSNKFSYNTALIADQLVNFRVTYDKMEDRYFVKPKPYDIRGKHVTGYILFTEKNEASLRSEFYYKADDWLFIYGILLVADNYRLETKNNEFQRDHSAGTIWEWKDVPASNGKYHEALSAIAHADEATIRFKGRQYYSDFDIPKKQQQIIRDILALFQDMKGG